MISKIRKILFISLIIFYLVIGITTIVFSMMPREKNANFCGTIVLITSIIHVLLYFIEGGYKNNEKSFYLVLGIVGVALGIVILANATLTITQICFYWGILEIIRGALETKQSILDLKFNKLEVVSLLIAIGNIVLGILLCIKLDHGLTAHLIYLGISFIFAAVKFVLDQIIEKKRELGETKN